MALHWILMWPLSLWRDQSAHFWYMYVCILVETSYFKPRFIANCFMSFLNSIIRLTYIYSQANIIKIIALYWINHQTLALCNGCHPPTYILVSDPRQTCPLLLCWNQPGANPSGQVAVQYKDFTTRFMQYIPHEHNISCHWTATLKGTYFKHPPPGTLIHFQRLKLLLTS